MGRLLLVLPWLCLFGCTEVRSPQPPDGGPGGGWPEWPAGPTSVADLLARSTRRLPAGEDVRLEGRDLYPSIRTQIANGRACAGWPQVLKRLGRALDAIRSERRDGFLLVGTSHDAPAQVDAFGRLVGPLGVPDWDAVLVEQVDATGGWGGIPTSLQRGDGEILTAYLQGGARADLERLMDAQKQANYTAFKYGYLGTMGDLFTTARAGGIRLRGCDMPTALQRRLSDLSEEQRLRMRELHCAQALEQAVAAKSGPIRVAALWGQDHLRDEGFLRFLSPKAGVVRLWIVGGRLGQAGPEVALSKRLSLTDPLMVQLQGPTDLLLILPAGKLQARLERTRTGPAEWDGQDPRHHLTVRSPVRGNLQLPHHRLAVDGEARTPIPMGWHAFLFETDGRAVAGALHMRPGTGLELDVDPRARSTDLIEYVYGGSE